jgi:hypothetical protein
MNKHDFIIYNTPKLDFSPDTEEQKEARTMDIKKLYKYKSFICALLDNGDVVYDNNCQIDVYKLEQVQHRSCIISSGAIRLMKHEMSLETLKCCRHHKITI